MLRVASMILLKARQSLLLESKASYIRGFWPEPITQPTLSKFLQDINYFEHPKKFVNIGLEQKSKEETKKLARKNKAQPDDREIESKEIMPEKVDEVLNLLAQDIDTPQLDFDDVRLEGSRLIDLAVNAGIYRDLFGKFEPSREQISFTPEQAKKLDYFVPYHWITDQPFARVNRKPKEPEPLTFFEPFVGVSAKFIHEENNDLSAHASFYGNFIPACEANDKPSITLDGKLLMSDEPKNIIRDSQFNNWRPGDLKLVNFERSDKYYSVAFVNLDYLHGNATNLHWMLANVETQSSSDASTTYDEICDYLPVHGINGFGYSRYVFIVFQHDSKLDSSALKIKDFSLESRRFDVKAFVENNKKINMVPVGLSWFQTSWDHSSNKIFHDYLKLKAPVYEYVQPELLKMEKKKYPGKIPFNIFLDHERDQKEINEQVLLERLKTIDPLDYKDQYVPPKVPPTIFQDTNAPSWMANVLFKKKNKIGYWRGLRPASALLPLDNNADLDCPLRPVASSKKHPPEFPNEYPGGTRHKSHKDMPTSRPVGEHQSIYIQEDHEIHLDKVFKLMKEFEPKEKLSTSSN